MKHVKLGSLNVGRIGLGTMGMSFAYTGAGSDDAESIRAIHRAIDLGVTLIDTAEVYGPYTNEELLGQALKDHRDQVVLATKFGMISHTGRDGLDSSPASIRTAIEGSLRRLGTDHIDLYYQHRVDPGTPITRLEENIAADTLDLTTEQTAQLDTLASAAGDHHNEAQMRMIGPPTTYPARRPCGWTLTDRSPGWLEAAPTPLSWAGLGVGGWTTERPVALRSLAARLIVAGRSDAGGRRGRPTRFWRLRGVPVVLMKDPTDMGLTCG